MNKKKMDVTEQIRTSFERLRRAKADRAKAERALERAQAAEDAAEKDYETARGAMVAAFPRSRAI